MHKQGFMPVSGVIAVVALLLGTLLGCTEAPPQEPPKESPSVQHSSNGRLIAVSGQASSAQEEALAEGTAAWGHGECMVIEAGETYLIMFPQGTTIDDDDEVTLPNGHVLRAGDEVALGGGFHTPDMTKSNLSAIPEKCLTEDVFWASGEVAE